MSCGGPKSGNCLVKGGNVRAVRALKNASRHGNGKDTMSVAVFGNMMKKQGHTKRPGKRRNRRRQISPEEKERVYN